ncbi:hydantoinase/oxoprolinase family protein [Bosea sp. BK604]|uniref:hydantoinase/oxoprolinase family protein n=1 Tax=Bosea sp. BK604 TaxID=2512180 RepID=UPI0010EB00EA|nr:hydantoinase/oxoprolinase family protein [Bosea sp. BK604]TCR68492.1 N-methylhydantoinase A [Bosea sp. BK604]
MTEQVVERAPERVLRIGVDVGGTFTDFQILDEGTGQLHEFKSATTPDDPARGFTEGLLAAAKLFDFPLGGVRLAMHGTTIATNAVLEHKLPRGALITTAGFSDVFEIGRHLRRHIYGLKSEQRYVMIPRALRFGARERISASGEISEPIDELAALELAKRLRAEEVGCVAICLLNAYINPVHERVLRDIVATALPDAYISLSSEVNPEIREYERMSTTVLNALLMPVVQRYLERLKARFSDVGLLSRLFLVQSNGGVASPEKAGAHPARLLLSGPCGGSVAAQQLSRKLGEPNLIAVDMGGTSFDVSVVQNGQTASVAETSIEGFPVRLPMVEIRTIGTGGGSIAWLDSGNRMCVGPHSAGANPGPACYGHGTEPTVTDANLALGRIDEANFLGGGMPLVPERSRKAISDRIAEPLGQDPDTAAEGILAVANAQLASAVRLSLFEKGLDPADFALVAFGGAGGLHGADVADELGIRRVIFPRNASTLSAYGILWSDIVHDASRSLLCPIKDKTVDELVPLVDDLVGEIRRMLDDDAIAEERREISLATDMRYKGQGFELSVPWGDVMPTQAGLAQAVSDFHEMHLRRFSHNTPGAPVELVTVRVTGRGLLPKPQVSTAEWKPPETERTRRVFLGGGWRDVRTLDRTTIAPGITVRGPALVTEDFSTLLLPDGWELTSEPSGDLIAERLAS